MIMMGDRKKQVYQILGPHKNEETQDDAGPDALTTLAEELIEAVHKKDASHVADCLRALFQELESKAHEEGPHTEE